MNQDEQIERLQKTIAEIDAEHQRLVADSDKFSMSIKVTQFRSAVSAARSQRYFMWFWVVYGLVMAAAAVIYWRRGVWLNASIHTALVGFCGWMLWLAHTRRQTWAERAREDLRDVPRDALGRINEPT